MHIFVKEESLPEAYHMAILQLAKYGEVVECCDYNTRCKEVSATIVVEHPFMEPMISRCFIGGHHELQQYVMEVCDGILDFMIGKGENVWEYTYHDRIKNQIAFVVEELGNNPQSRRAVINVRDNDVDMHNDHPACLQHAHFMIRSGKLDLKILMRSNDLVEATFMNAFAFIQLQKRIADQLGVSVGSYTHTANSLHVYEKDWELLDNCVKRVEWLFQSNDIREENTYNYKGFYDTLMEDEIPAIMSMVQAQKNKYGV